MGRHFTIMIIAIVLSLVSYFMYGGNPINTYLLAIIMMELVDFFQDYRNKKWGS